MPDPEQNQPVGAVDPFLEGLFGALRRLNAGRSAIILAVSGGCDSTALTLATSRISGRLGLSLTVACLDHGLRPEAHLEVQRVAALAEELKLPFVTRALGLEPGSGAEERARLARYAALEDLRQERNAAFVATAHTASDQAETLLMRLGRGSALKGAAGILERSGHLLRPLLFATRAEVSAWLTAQGRTWIHDPMNDDSAYLRVKVRQSLVPAFEAAFGDGVVVRLGRFASLAQEDDALLTRLADEAWDQVRLSDGNLSAALLVQAPRPLGRRWLVRYLTERGVRPDFELVNDALNAVALGRTQTLPKDLILATRAGVVRVEPSAPRTPRPAGE
jgi:tRNA(Ile)-lysidine synthase